ncbi:hypothetical protein RI367_004121 [Sorochytrium milnesiophthora]
MDNKAPLLEDNQVAPPLPPRNGAAGVYPALHAADQPPPYQGPVLTDENQASSSRTRPFLPNAVQPQLSGAALEQPPVSFIQPPGDGSNRAALAAVVGGSLQLTRSLIHGVQTVAKPLVQKAVEHGQIAAAAAVASASVAVAAASSTTTAARPTPAWQPVPTSSPPQDKNVYIVAAPPSPILLPPPHASPPHWPASPIQQQQQQQHDDDCCCCCCCGGCYDMHSYMEPANWALVAYGLLFDLPFAVFGFAWCLCTAIVCSALFIIPPLGVVCTRACAFTWRALGRCELFLITHGTGHHLANQQYIQTLVPPLSTVPTDGSGEPDCNLRGPVVDAFARRAALYFIVVKLWTALHAFVLLVLCVCVGFPFALLLGALPMRVIVWSGRAQIRLAYWVLVPRVRMTDLAFTTAAASPV